jgi:beta-xylosidase
VASEERSRVVVIGATVLAVALGGFFLVSLVRALESSPCSDIRFRTTAAPEEEFGGAPPDIANDDLTRALRSAFRPGSASVYCNDFPDPFVLVDGGDYYAYATNTFGFHVPVLTSGGLFDDGARKEGLPNVASWASEEIVWAPAVAEMADRYVMWYSTSPLGRDVKCLSVATASAPDGPFVDESSQPLRCEAIDASPFVDDDGSAFLVWSHDPAGGIQGARLAEDGLSLQGDAQTLLRANQPWEGGKIEAPSMIKVDGTYYLFYSGNRWDTASYAVGYATCEGPLGPCSKPLDGPWLPSSENAHGPGGSELFRDPGGDIWMALHAWIDGKVGYTQGARHLFVVKLEFEDGVPVPA